MTLDAKAMPVLLVKPKTVSRSDIARAKKAGFICIIECADPESARFIDPPIDATINDQARAAIELFRMILRTTETSFHRGTLTKFYCDALLNSPLPTSIGHVQKVKS